MLKVNKPPASDSSDDVSSVSPSSDESYILFLFSAKGR